MSVPEATVVIPTLDRPGALQACLGGLARQTCLGRFEVIVVDDGSVIPAQPTVPRGLDVRVVGQRHTGVAAARNAGAAVARGRVVAFTDDDCVPDPDWLERLLRAVDADPGALHAGSVASAPGVGLLAEASQELISYLVSRHNRDTANAAFVTGNNLAVTRSVFDGLGGFDAGRMPLAAGEDLELCERARRSDVPVRFTAAARVVHHNPMSPGGFLRLHHRYGRGARLLHRARPRPGRVLPADPARFYAGLVLFPLRTRRSPRAVALSVLLAVSQVAHAVGYATECVRSTGAGGR